MRRVILLITCWLVASGAMSFAGEDAAMRKLLADADGAFRQGKYLKAAKLYEEFVEEFPMNEQLADRGQFMAAESYFNGNRLPKAYSKYEEYLSEYPRTKRFEEVLGREYEIGDRYCAGYMRRFLWMPIVSSGSLGVEVLERVIDHGPQGKYADMSQMRIANYYMESKYYDQAREQYEILLKNYPESRHAPRARVLRALAAQKGVTGVRYNADNLEDAEKELKEARIIDQGGDTEREIDSALAVLREKQLESDYETAKFYMRAGRPIAAELCLKAIVKKAPKSRFARYARASLAVLEKHGAKKE